MRVKLLLFSFILGILTLNVFAQDNGNGSDGGGEPGNRGYLSVPIPSGDVEFIPPLSFSYTATPLDSVIFNEDSEELETKGASNKIIHVLTLKKNDVGIGTTSPSTKLHVAGTGLFTNVLTVGNPTAAIASAAKLQIGETWTFSDLSSSKIMGYNYRIQESSGSQGRLVDGSAAAVILNTSNNTNNNGSIQLCTAPYGIKGNPIVWEGYFTMLNNGNVGIGITNPLTKFQIGNIWTFYDGPSDKIIGRNTYWNGSSNVRIQQGVASRIYFGGAGDIVLQTAPTGNANTAIDGSWNTVTMKNDGKVGIGTTDPGAYKLKVNGNINCTEVIITAAGQQNGGSDEWPDYVFAQDYSLRSLDDVASYIEQNQRLPEIPSAAEVAEKGINLSEINALLLKKVEELTLYILDLQKQVDELKK